MKMLLVMFFVLLTFSGCSNSSLREENQRLTLTSLKIIMLKNLQIDSLTAELEQCRHIKELRATN